MPLVDRLTELQDALAQETAEAAALRDWATEGLMRATGDHQLDPAASQAADRIAPSLHDDAAE